VTSELSKVYDPKQVEKAVYERWTKAGAFNADARDTRPRYCIVIPPPNVTAALHLGHALNNALQDILIRFRRMRQFNTLWMPGTDHAGIATQTVVEKRILAEEGRRRTDFDRQEFITRIVKWKDEYEATIIRQLELMGCSCDWRRRRFTMDEVCARAVRAAFFKLFADGLIYRGKRLVNWDPATQTVLADDEVEHERVQGHFWYMRYPLAEPASVHGKLVKHVTVATTRPETMLGDTAVAMNPADPRAKYLVGKQVRLPLVGRIIPIIADDHVVLPNPDSDDEKARFSTGFLKVTPAHDPDDYEIGQRHNLPVVNVLAPDGSISDRHGWTDWEQIKNPDVENVIGMDRFEAREAIVEWFRKENLLEDVREYTHEVGHSYRSHVPIEPYLSDQWYVAVKKPITDCPSPIADWAGKHPELAEQKDGIWYLEGTDVPVNSLAGLALTPLLDGRLKFTPERYAATYRAWLENLRDWPISRQLWWGHRIPVWSRKASRPEILGAVVFSPLMTGATMRVVRENGECFVFGPGDDCERMGELRDATDREEVLTWYVCLSQEDLDWISVRPKDQHGLPVEMVKTTAGEWLESNGFVRDGDVLDTWFSSALWPFSTLGWPVESDDLRTFYPGDVLCTAREIITLSVSRMVMMGQYCVGDIPFSDVFIHAMIQDGQGRKMSKSLGNGIDPLDIIDSHGADAMRFTLAAMTTQIQDVRMPVEEMTLPDGRRANTSPKFDIGRNFCNKLWNASRFVMMNLQSTPAWSQIHPAGNLSDAWILSRLQRAVRDATGAIEAFRFNELADTLYHFMWDEFCDWYVEIAKARINAGEDSPKAVLAHCLDVLLRLLHPVTPFITEAIWQHLNEVAPVRGPGDMQAEHLLVTANWPHADAGLIHPPAEEQLSLLRDLIRQVRNVRKEHGVPPDRKVDVVIEAEDAVAGMIADNADLLKSQAQIAQVTISREAVAPPATAAAVASGGVRLYVLDIIDRDAEIARLTRQVQTLRRGIQGIEGKLANESFLAKAPPAVVGRERERLASLDAELAAVTESLETLK